VATDQTDNRAYMTRRAYRLGVFNGVMFAIGWAFAESSTVLPMFVSELTRSKVAVGLVSTIGLSGWSLPQLFAAGWIQHQPYKRPNYILTTTMRGLGWAATIPIVYFLGARNPMLALIGFLLGYSLFSFGGGLGGPAFLDIVAKTVAPNRLGSFFANREFYGALGGIGCGLVVRKVLASPALPFPTNYALLFLIALCLFVPGWAAFAMVKEPPGPVREAQPLWTFLSRAPDCLRLHRDFRRLVVGRMLLGATTIAAPFYIVYCNEVLRLPRSTVGTFLSLSMAGAVLANPLWGWLNDRRSPHALLRVVTVLSTGAPALALLVSLLPLPLQISRVGLGLVFFSLGTTGAGSFIGFTNYVLAIASEARRPLYVGVMNTLFAVTLLLPMAGGVVVKYASYQVLFVIATVFSLAGTRAVFRLPPCDRDSGPNDVAEDEQNPPE
jgi:hypothetical protein